MTATAPQIATRQFKGLDIPEAGTFEIDASHSAAAFTVRHMVVAKTRGRFTDFSGEITIHPEPLSSSVNVPIQAASITTGDDKRDEHLRGADFLDVEKYPTLEFKSTSVKHVGSAQFEVLGDLTIAGVTKPVTLELDYDGTIGDPWGGQRAGFTAKTKINREDWGLSYNMALETGGVLIGKEITIDLEVEAVRSAQ